LTKINQLKPYNFNFIRHPSVVRQGFFAHELAEIIPQAVSEEKDAVDDNGEPIYQGVDSSHIIPSLVSAVQELSAKVEALENA
jgi:hypothetical protein